MTDSPASPCVEICRLDASGDWCLGCGRSTAEIAAWPTASDAVKAAILAALPARLAKARSR